LQKLLGVENQMDLATTYSVNENQADTPILLYTVFSPAYYLKQQ